MKWTIKRFKHQFCLQNTNFAPICLYFWGGICLFFGEICLYEEVGTLLYYLVGIIVSVCISQWGRDVWHLNLSRGTYCKQCHQSFPALLCHQFFSTYCAPVLILIIVPQDHDKSQILQDRLSMPWSAQVPTILRRGGRGRYFQVKAIVKAIFFFKKVVKAIASRPNWLMLCAAVTEN